MRGGIPNPPQPRPTLPGQGAAAPSSSTAAPGACSSSLAGTPPEQALPSRLQLTFSVTRSRAEQNLPRAAASGARDEGLGAAEKQRGSKG